MTRPRYLHASAGIIGQMEATYVDSPHTLGGHGPLHYRDKSHRVESHRDHQETALFGVKRWRYVEVGAEQGVQSVGNFGDRVALKEEFRHGCSVYSGVVNIAIRFYHSTTCSSKSSICFHQNQRHLIQAFLDAFPAPRDPKSADFFSFDLEF